MNRELLRHGTRATPQDRPIRGQEARQVRNAAGGYSYRIDSLARLRRWLVLGSEGTYYASRRQQTADNVDALHAALDEHGTRAVDEIVAVSVGGLAPKQTPALFALAAAAGHSNKHVRAAALEALPQVARTGTHLFEFARYVELHRGWGKGLQRAVARWYTDKDADALALQVVKYRQRDGWSHQDMLRLAKPGAYRRPAAPTDAHRALFDFVCGRDAEPLPRLVEGFKAAQSAATAADAARLVREYRLPWEALQSEHVATDVVWDALLEAGLPATAMLRNLPRLTGLGLLSPLGAHRKVIEERLSSPEALAKARVHPYSVLLALATYRSGRSLRGDSTWKPEAWVVDTLDRAFYAAFGAVTPVGKPVMLALDVSGSMTSSFLTDGQERLPISAREASAAMALVTAAVEPQHMFVGFTGGTPTRTFGSRQFYSDTAAVSPLTISPRERLDDVVRTVSGLPFGRTDCALPMLYAEKNNLEVDAFVIYTDNETWSGSIHPSQALERYRQTSGRPATLAVVGMTSVGYSIADPADAGMLDVVGFDASAPNIISAHARREV